MRLVTSSRVWALRTITGVLAASAVLAAPSVTSQAASGPTAVSVLSSQVFTDTGLTVKAGEVVSVSAAGRIHFGPPPIDQVAPAGIARAGNCSGRGTIGTWPAPDLACWALIGKVGSAPPFEIGGEKPVRVPSAGELFLGINDNRLADNAGSWSAEVRVNAGPNAAGSNDSNSTLLIVIAAAVLVTLLVVVALLMRRRRAADRRAAE
ncbi:MAG: hypothetical protein QOE62_2610 [Actinomycetota bacterium]|jgi:hypothetical protein|nr:hypothetical protein [Actinomycetota bacterium]